MTKLKYTFKSDILFKMLFVKHQNILRELVAAALGILNEDIEEFSVLNGEIVPESIGKKYCRLDINLKVNGQLLDIEIQVNDEGNYRERVLMYWAKNFAGTLNSGRDYAETPKTIIISIIDFKLFDCEEYHSEFVAMERTRGDVLTDKMSIQFYELCKLPEEFDGSDKLMLFLQLFKAEAEEELQSIEKLEVPIVNEAITAYREITQDPDYLNKEMDRLLALFDEAQSRHYAEQRGIAIGLAEGKAEGKAEERRKLAREMLLDNVPVEKVMRYTGLTEAELKAL